MPHTPKVWKNAPDPSTPLSAEALIDLEQRLAGYTDDEVAALVTLLNEHGHEIADVAGLADALAARPQLSTDPADAGSAIDAHTGLPLSVESTSTVLAAPSGGDDRAAINAVLAAATPGQIVRGRPGATYLISGPIIVKSKTMLDMTGCTIAFTSAAVKTNMLQNEAVAPTTSASNTATTAGSAVITSSTLAAAATPGQRLAVVGAGAAGGNGGGPCWLYGTVLSVNTGAGTVTIDQAANLTVSGAAGYLFGRDSDITIVGGLWDTGASWTEQADRVAAGYNSHQLRLRRCDRLTVRDLKFKQDTFVNGLGWCFGVNPADCTDVLVENCRGDNSCVVVQGNGPLARVIVRNIQGDTQDDMVAFGCVDFQGNDTEGDILDVLVDGVSRKSYGSAVKFFAGTGTNGVRRTCRGTIRSVHNGKVNIVDYTSGAGAGPIYALVEDVTGADPVNDSQAITNTAVYGYVARNPSGAFHATDIGMLLATCDPADAGGTFQPGTGIITLAMVKVPSSIKVTDIVLRVGTAGAGLTVGRVGIYDADGVLIAKTADQSTAWQTVGVKTMALTAESGKSLRLPGGPGVYYRIALLAVGTTIPIFPAQVSGIGLQLGMTAGPVSTSRIRVGYHATGGQTSLPASIAAATLTDTGQVGLPWIGAK